MRYSLVFVPMMAMGRLSTITAFPFCLPWGPCPVCIPDGPRRCPPRVPVQESSGPHEIGGGGNSDGSDAATYGGNGGDGESVGGDGNGE
ncbi:hypothetical protein FRB95_012389 [Tulasnella sp. JGI-2019a]|nr:hypothetical protein FRB93_007364 [Tulasnella sp. JGI-2019a]KAG9023866.1 hypothetical protein FRB95_012389 [Tulasnella sp. JGI-2019a]